MNTGLRDKDHIGHIVRAIDKINGFIGASGKNGFFRSELTQDAVIRNLEVIGEAVSKLGVDLKDSHPEIPWQQISGMRNRLIHGYMTVNLEIVWNTVVKVLPEFKKQIENITANRK